MKYVADALIEDGQSNATIIGIASLGVINKRQDLLEAEGAYVEYGDPDVLDRPHVSLDQNHSHYILVDDGSVDSFGVEVGSFSPSVSLSPTLQIPLRARLEGHISALKSPGEFGCVCPIATVCIVIQVGLALVFHTLLLFFPLC